MPWFAVDDEFYLHPKAVAAGNAALGLWVRAGSWCMKHLTDGRIPRGVVETLGSRAQARKLVAAGLWHETPDGFAFHDWEQWGGRRTRDQVEAQRRKDAERKARQRAKDEHGFSAEPQVSEGGHGVTPHGQDVESQAPNTNTNTKKKNSLARTASEGEPAEFTEFYEQAYPRRIARQQALKAWKAAVRKGTDPQAILAAARRFAAECERRGTDKQYVPYPSTWLNGARWEDYPADPAPAPATAWDPVAWLEQQIETAAVSEIARRTGLQYQAPPLPRDLELASKGEIGQWHMRQRREWIRANREQILAKLTKGLVPA